MLAQGRFEDRQRTFDELDRTMECCTQRWAQLDLAIPDDPAASASQDDADE
ncbi:MAG: hypothetical protein JWN93_1314 [Hyphomicrobiales bacterium]|nr:hypothetical protein [Hyphomicrobiales bacterium]